MSFILFHSIIEHKMLERICRWRSRAQCPNGCAISIRQYGSLTIMAIKAPELSNVAFCSASHRTSAHHYYQYSLEQLHVAWKDCDYLYKELDMSWWRVEKKTPHNFYNTWIWLFPSKMQPRCSQQNKIAFTIPISNTLGKTLIFPSESGVSLTSAEYQKPVWTAGTQALIVISVAYQADWHP